MCTKIFRINSSPDTLRPHPDTPRHNSDTPRHRHLYAIQGTGRKSNIRVSWPNIFVCQLIWYWCLPRHHQTPSRHHPDTLRHHPDTPKHRRFYATEGTGRKGNIRVWPISNFANWFGIATSWDLLSPQTHSRHQADTPRHNPDTPSYRSFCKKGHWKKRQYLSFMTFYNML